MFDLFRKRPVQHQQPDGTTREFFKACNVYCRPESDQVIVASVYNHGGLMAEKPGGASIASFSDTSALNSAICASIDGCQYEENFNYFGQKRSDWPAFQASGYKTIKRFEAEFIRLLIKGVNEKNLFYDVASPEFGEFGLHLTITVNPYTENFGEAVQYIIKRYLVCKSAVEAADFANSSSP
jgi:hypothetical protein